MATLDRYDSDYKCPSCHAEAVGRVSENDYPFMKKLNRRIEIASPFITKVDIRGDDVVWCGKCGVEAK